MRPEDLQQWGILIGLGLPSLGLCAAIMLLPVKIDPQPPQFRHSVELRP